MASFPKISRRVLLWNALISSALALLTLLVFVVAGATMIGKKFTTDVFGRCSICRYEVVGYIRPQTWNDSFRKYALALPALTIYGFASCEMILRNEIRTARSSGRQLTSWLRPFTGDAELRDIRKKWGPRALVLFIIQMSAFLIVIRARLVEDKLPAGLSLPLSLLNETVMYAETDDNVWNADVDPRLNGSLHIANPSIPYAQLYPNDSFDIPGNWANTSLYLPSSYMPVLESRLYESTHAHFNQLRSWQRGGYGKSFVNATYSRGGFPLGDAIYSKRATEGLGINMTSYEEFSGTGSTGLPRQFEFQLLFGESWVTNVSVYCRRVLGHRFKWDESTGNQDPSLTANRIGMIMTKDSKRYHFHRPEDDELQIFTDFDVRRFDEPITMLTSAGPEVQHSNPQLTIQTITIPHWSRKGAFGTVFECTYMPSEFHKSFMAFANLPIREIYGSVNNMTTIEKTGQILSPAKNLADELEGKCLSPMYALPAARAIHELLSSGGPGSGGALGLALRELDLPKHQRMRDLSRFLEEALSETAQAYFSLVRQRVERANAWPPDHQIRHPSAKFKILFFKIQRLGGGSAFSGLGLCVLVLIAFALGLSFLRIFIVAVVLPFLPNLGYRTLPQSDVEDEKDVGKDLEKTSDDGVDVE